MIESLNCKGKQDYCMIDLCKFICALFVVGIHSNAFVNIGLVYNELITQGLFRLAVPLFYTISGFLFSMKADRVGKTALVKQEKNLITVYLTWSVVYFFEALFLREITDLKSLAEFVLNTVFRASKYHLWFLLALIYAIPFLYFIRKISVKLQIVLIAFLWIVQCFAFSYRGTFPEIGKLFYMISQTADAPWNTLFCALPLLIVGNLVNCFHTNKKVNDNGNICICIISILLIVEKMVNIIVLYSPANSHFFIFMPMFTFFLVLFFVKSRKEIKHSVFLRKASLFIYCIHPLIIDILIFNGFSYGLLLCFAVLIVSIVFFSFYFFGKGRFKCY